MKTPHRLLFALVAALLFLASCGRTRVLAASKSFGLDGLVVRGESSYARCYQSARDGKSKAAPIFIVSPDKVHLETDESFKQNLERVELFGTTYPAVADQNSIVFVDLRTKTAALKEIGREDWEKLFVACQNRDLAKAQEVLKHLGLDKK